jgi:hypothetical protein
MQPADLTTSPFPAISKPEPDTDHAIAFLQWLDGDGRHDLAVIDPNSPGIKAATFLSPVQWDLVRAWIDERQGRKNLYTSVNSASANAPVGQRLSAADIGHIRAIVLDVDPKKIKGGDPSGENFNSERRRLNREVAFPLAKNPNCPPTWLVDSGGGYQAWWQLAEPLPATPENVALVERIGRTIASRYGGDPVWDVPRIMRLPGTINVPSPDKAAQGRSDALAYALGASSQKTYTIEQLATWAPPTAVRAKRAAELPDLDMDVVTDAACFDDLLQELRDKFAAACSKDAVLEKLWNGTRAPEQTDTSPSGYAFALAGRLGRAGNFTVNDFGSLYWVWEYQTEKEIDARYIGRAWTNNPATAGAEGFEVVPIAPERSGKRNAEPDRAQDVAAMEWGEPADVWMDETNPPDLPQGVVPAIVEAAARDDARRLGIEPGASAAARIVALGSLVPAGNQMQMRQRDTGWTVRPVLWMGLFGPPGSNKSATLKYAMTPVTEIQNEWAKRYAQEKRAFDAKHPPEKAKKAKKTRDSEPDLAHDGPAETIKSEFDDPEPNFRRKLVEDATTEKLADLLKKNPDGLLYFGDELAGLFAGMDAYRAKAGKDRPIWLKFKDGAAVIVDRIGRDSIHVPVGAVSVLGGMQPEKVQALSAGLSDDGMLQRFLPMILKRTGCGEDMAPDQEIADTVRRIARSLVDSGPGKRFRFTIEGDLEWHQLESFVSSEMAMPKASTSFTQWLEKLPNEFGRIALVFHFIEWYARSAASSPANAGPPELVSGETARRARRFLEDFAYPHAAVFYNLILGASQIEEHARWVAGFILARGRTLIEERDVYKNYSAFKGKDTRGDLTNTMRDLELNDWLRPTKFSSGRPTHWAINPAVHDVFAEQARSERERRTRAMDAIARAASVRRAGDKSPAEHVQ